jgi:apolipoprotein N-acyltransferase
MIERLLQRRGRIIALAAGLLLPLGFAPFGWWWLLSPLLAVLFLLLHDEPARERLLRGFWFGFGSFAAGTWWLYISVHDFGGAPAPFAILVTVLLVLLMAGYHALFGWLSAAVRPDSAGWQTLAVLPACWTLIEWLRSWLFGGFPWLSLGYSATDGWLMPWAPLAGVHGTSLVIALTGGGLATLVNSEGRTRIIAACVVVALLAATPVLGNLQYTRPGDPAIRVAIVQGGVAQDRKWLTEELESTMALYQEMTLNLVDVDLVVWPEAAIPALAHEIEEYLDALGEVMKARRQQLILGILTYDFDISEFRNSLLAVGAEAGVYHKRHLVPFGEYFPVPGFIRDFLRLLNLPYQDIAPGPRVQPPLRVRGVSLAPSICYEDVFGTEARDFLPDAGVLVNVSNDGWFGNSIAPHQHLQMARFRALESGRPMIRSTNTGISAVIGSDGAIMASGRQFVAATVLATVRPRSGTTPWVRFGNVPMLLASILLLLMALAGKRRVPMM